VVVIWLVGGYLLCLSIFGFVVGMCIVFWWVSFIFFVFFVCDWFFELCLYGCFFFCLYGEMSGFYVMRLVYCLVGLFGSLLLF